MRRWKYVILLVAISVVAYVVYASFRPPVGMEPLGGNEEAIANIGLWTAVISAIGAFFSLLKDVIGLFNKSED